MPVQGWRPRRRACRCQCRCINVLPPGLAQVYSDCSGVANGGCNADCKAGLDAVKAQGSACEANFKAQPGRQD